MLITWSESIKGFWWAVFPSSEQTTAPRARRPLLGLKDAAIAAGLALGVEDQGRAPWTLFL